jgi:hypothetical protein
MIRAFKGNAFENRDEISGKTRTPARQTHQKRLFESEASERIATLERGYWKKTLAIEASKTLSRGLDGICAGTTLLDWCNTDFGRREKTFPARITNFRRSEIRISFGEEEIPAVGKSTYPQFPGFPAIRRSSSRGKDDGGTVRTSSSRGMRDIGEKKVNNLAG